MSEMKTGAEVLEKMCHHVDGANDLDPDAAESILDQALSQAHAAGKAEAAAEVKALREALVLLYSWARNWDSPFMEEDEWPEDEAKIKAALSGKGGQ